MSLEDIPQAFADYFEINLTSAQVILSIFMICAVLLPVMYLSRDKNATTVYLFMFLLIEGALVGLGWLPFWFLIATVVLMALGLAKMGGDLVTGSR